MPPQIGTLTDLVEIGRGGFGIVYRATDAKFGRSVAVKVIRDAGLQRDVRARFERECLALGHLSGHPNIVAVHDSGSTDDGELYLVMELLDGGSLNQLLTRSGPPDPALVADWGAALAGALETAHRAGIVHRDVKPENVLFSGYEVPKLVDFGIARMRSAYETRTGFVSATLNHAAPEVVAGAAVAPSADTYSLASVLHTMLSGKPPFDRGPEESLAPMIARISSAPPPDLRPLGVPAQLAAVIERGLAKDAAARYQTAAELGEALADAARALGRAGAKVPLGASRDLAEAQAELEAPLAVPVAAEVRRDPTVDVPRVRAATFDGDGEGAAARQAPWYRKPAAMIATAALVAGAVGGSAYLALRGDDGAPAAAGSKKEPTSNLNASVQPDPLTAPGLTVKQSYDTDGTTISYGATLTNTTGKPSTRFWTEVVPKELASSVSQVQFTPAPTGVIVDDPVVYWKFTLPAGGSAEVRWSTPVPEDGARGAALITQVQSWTVTQTTAHRARIDAKLKQLAKAARKGNGATPVVTDVPDRVPATPTPTTTPTKTPKANRPPTITGGSTSTGEQQSVSVPFRATDPDGRAPTVRIVSGAPSWARISGSRVVGTVPWSAVSGRGSRTWTITLRATDAKGRSATARVTIRVTDTHFQMPNLRGQYQDDVLASSYGVKRDHRGCRTESMAKDKIWKTDPGAGSILRYGATVRVWYVTGNESDPLCSSI